MSELRWSARCAHEGCEARWVVEHRRTVATRRLPDGAETEEFRWTVTCEQNHSFLVRAAKQHGDYLVVVP